MQKRAEKILENGLLFPEEQLNKTTDIPYRNTCAFTGIDEETTQVIIQNWQNWYDNDYEEWLENNK